LNILFVISSLKHGGAEKQTVIDANLFSENHKVSVITFQKGELESSLSKKVNLKIIKKNGYLCTSKKIREFILNENIQIINASLFAAMIISYLAARNTNVPVIWYIHSHEYDIQYKSKIALKYFSKSDVVKKIFFVSNELKNSFMQNKYFLSDKKQEVLYNSYSINNINKEKIVKTDEKIIIGYVGRLVELKRVEYLIELAEYLKKESIVNFRIDIVGDGETKQKLIEQAKKLNINEFIKFLGFKHNVEEEYLKFDLFVLPSGEECLSISLIDAGVSGLPCVAFRIGANDEIVINEKTGYLVNSKQDMFKKIKKLLLNGKKRIEFGNEAKKYCSMKFDNRKRIKFLEDVFLKLNK
jgi:L-malate glycosyltransferase